MARLAHIVDVFVSSPGDVSSDRKIVVDTAQSWNQRHSKRSGIFFNILTWESKVSPGVSSYSQNVVNEQIGDKYDLLIGLMWHRFGTPTAVADSGTQEEFERALDRFNSSEITDICFMFKTTDPPFKDIEPEQLKKVKEFKSEISEKGCFYREYNSQDDLRQILEIVFGNFEDKFDHNRLPDSNLSKYKNDQDEDVEQINGDDEFGYFDYLDNLNESSKELQNLMSEWTEEMAKLSTNVNQSTDEINSLSRFGRIDLTVMRPITIRVTESMESYFSSVQTILSKSKQVIEDISSSVAGVIELSQEFSNDESERHSALVSVLGLLEAMDHSLNGLFEFNLTLESLPRLDKKFNRARSAIIESHNQFMSNIRNSRQRIDIAREALEN